MDVSIDPQDTITLPIGFIDGFASAANLNAVLQVVSEWIPQLVGAGRASVALADDDALEVYALRGKGEMTAGFRLPIDNSLAGVAFKERRVTIWRDSTNSDTADGAMLTDAGLRCSMNVPLMSGGECYGTVNVGHPQAGYYGPDDAAVMKSIASWIASHVRIHRQVIEARELARTDSLTQTLTRGAFFETGNELWTEFQSSGSGFALALIDLDEFKAVNDSYGHTAGDAALRAFSEEVRTILRAGDHVGRLGGEEFGVIVTGLGSDDAVGWADRLRDRIEHLVITDGGAEISVTISIGVAQPIVGDGGFDGVYRRADEALYGAKGRGRNNVLSAA